MTMTTVGYGDITPVNSSEKIVTMLMMFVSCAIFAWIMGYVGSVIAISDSSTKNLKEEIHAISSFMQANRIPQKLKTKVRRHLDYLVEYKTQFKLEEEQVLDMLSENLRFELIIHLNGSMLRSMKSLKNFDILFLSSISSLLKKQTFNASETIFKEGDESRKIYFIIDGVVSLRHNRTRTLLKELF